MRFLANENFPVASIKLLREIDHNVRAIIEDSPGANDRTVLRQANEENRLILTFDRDYGELVYRHKLPIPAGVVYFRFAPLTPVEPAERLLRLLQIDELTIQGKFTVVGRERIRQRPLP